MSKQELILAIRQQNASATEEFLMHFDERQLTQYLDHLHTVHTPRGATSMWIRERDTPAVVGYAA